MVCEQDPHLGAVVGFAVTWRHEGVAGSTGALVGAGRVGTQLVTVAPLLALVLIHTRSLVQRADRHALVTVAGTTVQ